MQKNIKLLHDYNKNHKAYHFFYDETNNYRKVRIKKDKLNETMDIINNLGK
jgi:hypothetical protein